MLVVYQTTQQNVVETRATFNKHLYSQVQLLGFFGNNSCYNNNNCYHYKENQGLVCIVSSARL